uniref:Phosphomannomutase n=1 Tax=Acrobeloides nanus TaxID=290746 RepID=A0A914DDD7_9BILA
MSAHRAILLFDVDGTLTLPRQNITDDMKAFLQKVHTQIPLAVVGGSDLPKIVEQLGGTLEKVQTEFDFVFSENGLVGFHGTKQLPVEALNTALGEERLQEVIDFCLNYISNIKLPIKRGTFIEYRKGMLNVSPIGRNCSQAERDDFVLYDEKEKIREKFVDELRARFSKYDLQFSIGGQISIDVFPIGWDKTYCLKHLTSHFDRIHFFGDKTSKGGNDYEIFEHEATIGHTVTSPEDTVKQVEKVLQEMNSN